ncbi:MFS transporter [Vibrio sp. 10N.286.49.C2]|uniref:multidrug effflux MFS transporter n=1 Tax=unclassified Vibrio TaxID=2614977 RepID=UPI000C85E4CB|nr:MULTISPECIES: multidrug effflux MFS transporter [unclassified Vibrio]PMH42822.1 MFS transporter [Vibrio sp. 10N.286.49.C2]PMH53839.1 MFS transporter [Vibrio sp. 10N.286.49.B1]PMH81686.1 MFS transporter [Vibrio sp. 10N.286.48.B7]
MSQPFNWKALFLACFIVSIGQFSVGLVFPSLPWIARDFAISADDTQLLISIYLLGFGPSQFFYGPISDALGRKPILIIGLSLALLGLTVVILGSNHFNMLLLGRFIQGLGAGCCAVLARASIRDSFNKDELPQALSWLAIVASFTPIVAPVFGGVINHHWGWLAVFVTLFSYIALVLFLLLFLFKETLVAKSSMPSMTQAINGYKSLLASRYFCSFAAVGWLNFSLVIISISVMPFIMQEQIGMTSEQYAAWALIPAFGLLTGGFICNRIRPRIGTEKMAFVSPLIHLISGCWLLVAPLHPLAMMAGQFLMAMGNGIALPCSQSKLLAPFGKQAGSVAALSGGLQMIIASLLSMLLMNLGLQFPWQLGIIIALFGIGSFTCFKIGFQIKE